MRPRIALVALVCGVVCVANAQQAAVNGGVRGGTVDGIVSDTALAPLDNASISILGSAIRVVTGANGRFRLTQLSPASYVIFVRRLGFRLVSATIQIADADTVRLAFALQPAVTTLDATIITARHVSPRLAEFEERREFALKNGGGQFMTADEIDKRNTVFATELIRTFHGIQVGFAQTLGGGRGPIAMTGRAAGSVNLACRPAVWLDGVLLQGPVNLDGLPSPKAIAGIEVYPGPAEVPPRYTAGGMSCGAILIWTR
jgi:carboxypeptidase family protein/TonB-dependent receptor-like protein